MTDRVVSCAFCGASIETGKACIGFGIEKPISESHYFCSEEHRSEFIISETARERGCEYTIRNYHNAGRVIKHDEHITDEDLDAMKRGEIITTLNEKGEKGLAFILDPFGDLKEY
jgi:ribosomal protein L24E